MISPREIAILVDHMQKVRAMEFPFIPLDLWMPLDGTTLYLCENFINNWKHIEALKNGIKSLIIITINIIVIIII